MLAAATAGHLLGGVIKACCRLAGVPPKEADAIVTENANARIDGLRSSLALLAIVALIALFATRRIPAQQPTASPESEPTALTGEP